MHTGIWLHSKMHSFYVAGAHAYANEYGPRFRSSRAHCHFCVCHRHAFSTLPLDPWSQHRQGCIGNLRRVLRRKGGSKVSPFCAACRPDIVYTQCHLKSHQLFPQTGWHLFDVVRPPHLFRQTGWHLSEDTSPSHGAGRCRQQRFAG